MAPETLVHQLRSWLEYESYVDPYGYISPSKMSIDIAHYYFVVDTKTFIKVIEDAKTDKQGGIIISYHTTQNKYKMHILMDGYINLYREDNSGNMTKEKFSLENNRKGFGTDKYTF